MTKFQYILEPPLPGSTNPRTHTAQSSVHSAGCPQRLVGRSFQNNGLYHTPKHNSYLSYTCLCVGLCVCVCVCVCVCARAHLKAPVIISTAKSKGQRGVCHSRVQFVERKLCSYCPKHLTVSSVYLQIPT